MGKNIDEELNFPVAGEVISSAMDLGNLGVIAPHKAKYYDRYNMQWLESMVDSGEKLKFVTFWKADEGCENNWLSQWYQGKPFIINGRKYYTAEQYMMSEKALMFNDFDKYARIMQAKDPGKCKSIGREKITGFDGKEWGRASREVIFHGNLGKIQANIKLVDALLSTENAILVETSPLDRLYGAGLAKDDLLNADGTLKVHPRDWHTTTDPDRQAENKLGFVWMGIRDLFRDLMKMGKENRYLE